MIFSVIVLYVLFKLYTIIGAILKCKIQCYQHLKSCNVLVFTLLSVYTKTTRTFDIIFFENCLWLRETLTVFFKPSTNMYKFLSPNLWLIVSC